MEKVRCVETFEVEIRGEDGNGTGEYMDVEEGTVWEITHQFLDFLTLNRTDIYSWIEIDSELFNECFEKCTTN